MNKFTLIATCGFLAATYAFIVMLGMGHLPLPQWMRAANPPVWAAWQAPDPSTISKTVQGDSIRYGMHLFRDTTRYAAPYTAARLTCSDCHIEGGIAPYAAPMVGTPSHFPKYSPRAGRKISLQDRIQECFTRSENGRPLPDDSAQMTALVAYLQWLSQPQPVHRPFAGRGLIALPALTPNPVHGAQIYASSCAGCHGVNGAGSRPLFPPLWGPDSFNDGAGMNQVDKMAAFVQANMPQNRRGTLSAQEAYDVAAFLHAQPHPAFNPAYAHF